MLTDNDIEAYKRDGFINGVRVMNDEQVVHYRQCFDRVQEAEGRDNAGNKLMNRHYDLQFIWEIAINPKILDCVEAILGPNFFMLGTHFFCKYGPQEKFVAWHQDLRYWGLQPQVEVTAWYAIDDSDIENGCMRVIPGLHRKRFAEHGKSDRAGNLLSINQEIAVTQEEETAAVDCVLKAGEISLHDGMLVHGSQPNHSSRRRCGLAVRYIPTYLRPVTKGPTGTDISWEPILVRGADHENNFETVPPPFPTNSPH